MTGIKSDYRFHDDLSEFLSIIQFFYPDDTPLRRLLLRHSNQVAQKAFDILKGSGLPLNSRLVLGGALLHDIGILRCRAPKILCVGTEPYLTHGIIGGGMLREFGKKQGIDLESYARICERHTGSGLTAEAIRTQNLPLPVQDFLPETYEEKIICLADKFFSKSGDGKEKSLPHIQRSMLRFGPDSLERLNAMCALFSIDTK